MLNKFYSISVFTGKTNMTLVYITAVSYVRRSFSINVSAGDEYDTDVSSDVCCIVSVDT